MDEARCGRHTATMASAADTVAAYFGRLIGGSILPETQLHLMQWQHQWPGNKTTARTEQHSAKFALP
jgi:hypothetical protein